MAQDYGSWQPWIDSVTQYLKDTWGVADDCAGQFAVFMAYLTSYGLAPQVVSGFRDPAKQAAMQARWDAGDRAGMQVRPATNSKHSRTNWLGNPASRALDIATSDPNLAAQIASHLGIRAGLHFSNPDPNHFDIADDT